MRNYKSTLEHFIALRKRRGKKITLHGLHVVRGRRRSGDKEEHFFTDRDKMGGGNAEWALVERTTLFIAKNSRHAPVRRKPAFWRIPGTFVWTKEEEATIQRLKSRITFFFSISKYIYTAIRKKTRFQVYENDLGLFFLDVNENFFLGGDDDFPNNNTGKNNIEFVSKGWNLVKTNIWPWLFIWRGDCETMIKILLYRDKNIETGFSLLPIF